MNTKSLFRFALGLALVLAAVAVPALAQSTAPAGVPEIGAGEIGSAVTLLAGGYLVLSAKFRSKK